MNKICSKCGITKSINLENSVKNGEFSRFFIFPIRRCKWNSKTYL